MLNVSVSTAGCFSMPNGLLVFSSVSQSCRETAWDSLVWSKEHEFYPQGVRSSNLDCVTTSLSLNDLVSKNGDCF